jgi:cyanophycin synthetase
MKVINIEIISGRNIYSHHFFKLMKVTLDLADLSATKLISIPDMINTVKKVCPQASKNTTWISEEKKLNNLCVNLVLAYLVAHMSRQLQCYTGASGIFKKVIPITVTSKVAIITDFKDWDTSKLALQFAVKFVNHILRNEEFDIGRAISQVTNIWDKNQYGNIAALILAEAKRHKIPILQRNHLSKIILGYGVNQKGIQNSFTSQTSYINVKLAGNKDITKQTLCSYGIPVPAGKVIHFKEDLIAAIKVIPYPIVVKPLSRNNGKGVRVNINNEEDALRAFLYAKSFAKEKGVIIEKYIKGFDYRILIVNHKVVAAAKRTPAMVIGDGKLTIDKLISAVNADQRRGVGHTRPLSFIQVDGDTLEILKLKNLSLDSILANDQKLLLKSISNISAGGTSSDVTDLVHPHNIIMAERISRIIGLDICGLDIISRDIGIPFSDGSSAVVEVNAAPGLRMHLQPAEGKSRNVTKPIIEMLFPRGTSPFIPIIAITGQLRTPKLPMLIAELFSNAGFQVGCADTNGIYIQKIAVSDKNMSLLEKSQLLLSDPTINVAVIECLASDMVQSGTGFENCALAIVSGANDCFEPETKEQNPAESNKVVIAIVKSVLSSGYVILNADDPNVFKISSGLKCNIAYYSLFQNNPIIISHVKKGGYAVTVNNDLIIGYAGFGQIKTLRITTNSIEATVSDTTLIRDALVLVLTGIIYNLDFKQIDSTLNKKTNVKNKIW